MLALDLDLEADLGIDTVKQAELFASVREEWGIPRDEKRKLRDYPTLNHVIAFVHQMRPDLAARPRAPRRSRRARPRLPWSHPPRPSPPPRSAPAAPCSCDPVREQILALVTEKTGYPPDMLDVELDLEADLGVDTVKQAELFASVREKWGIPRDENRKLRDYPTLRHVIDFVHQMRPDLEPAAPCVSRVARRHGGAAGHSTRAGSWRRIQCARRSSRSSPRRPAIPPTCSTSTWTSRPTSASTP